MTNKYFNEIFINKYSISISTIKSGYDGKYPRSDIHLFTIDSWRNFVKACEYDVEVIHDRLETEYKAKLINDVIVFEDEKDKIMWLLRWG